MSCVQTAAAKQHVLLVTVTHAVLKNKEGNSLLDVRAREAF